MTARRRALWIVAALLLADVVASVVAVTLLPGVGWDPQPSAAPTISATSRAATSPALEGYPVLNGNQGYPIAVGRPWGTPCAPIALVAAEGTPDGLRQRLDEVLAEAAAGGVPVVGPGRAPPGREVPTVQVAADATSTPTLGDGRPQQVLWFLQTSLDPSGRTETMRVVSTGVFTRAARDEVAQRRALRSLLARSFGLAGSTAPGSGLTAELGSTLDAFSPADLAALRAMAGCG
jgi:hypothetical protein